MFHFSISLFYLFLFIIQTQNKLFIGEIEAIILKHKSDEGFVDNFQTYKFKIADDSMIFLEKNDFGYNQPLEIQLRDLRFFYDSNIFPWELYSQILSWQNKYKLFYFPYEKEIIKIQKKAARKLQKSYLIQTASFSKNQYQILIYTDNNEEMESMIIAAKENYAIEMKNAPEKELSDLPNNMKIKMDLLNKQQTQFSQVEVGVLKESLQISNDFDNIGSMIFGLRYANIKNCEVELNIPFPEKLSVSKPSCCFRIKQQAQQDKPLTAISRTLCLRYYTPDLCILNARIMAKKLKKNCKISSPKIKSQLKQKIVGIDNQKLENGEIQSKINEVEIKNLEGEISTEQQIEQKAKEQLKLKEEEIQLQEEKEDQEQQIEQEKEQTEIKNLGKNI